MYSFETLHPDREFLNGRSVAYWIGALNCPLPQKYRDPAVLAAAMSFHFDVEEQAWDEQHIRTEPELLFDVFAPVAPVSLSEAWSPFPFTEAALGTPEEAGLDETSTWHRPAYAVFTVPPAWKVPPVTNAHERHFAKLLCGAANAAGTKRLLVVAQPGWSYNSCGRMPRTVTPVMRSVGYLVTERRSWPWWMFWR
jgi:hypothetical protein